MISARLRFLIIKRDSGRCLLCGRSGEEVPLHVDHVFAKSLGGKDEPSNLATLCCDCNLGKGIEQIDDDSLRQRISRTLQLPLPKVKNQEKSQKIIEHGSEMERVIVGTIAFRRGNTIHILPDSEHWKIKLRAPKEVRTDSESIAEFAAAGVDVDA